VIGYIFDMQNLHLLPPAGFAGARRMLESSSSPSANPDVAKFLWFVLMW
jgi:hypothetical protein